MNEVYVLCLDKKAQDYMRRNETYICPRGIELKPDETRDDVKCPDCVAREAVMQGSGSGSGT